jgi:rubrerythrin
METKFNVFEILQVAEKVELRGARFYLKAGELFKDSQRRDIYHKLASWKARHAKIWARLRKRFSEKTGEFGTFDPDNYVLSNPGVMAGLTWFDSKQAGLRRLTGCETKQEILRDAVRRENEIIVFYQGLKDFARDPASQGVVDQIVGQENRHITLILQLLQQVSTTSD